MKYKPKDFKIGVLGGGQLAKMLHQESMKLDIELHFMDADPACSVAKVSPNFIQGNLTNYNDVIEFGKKFTTLTIEIENVNVQALHFLQAQGVKVFPQANVLEIIQDKGLQKQFFLNNNIPTSTFYFVESADEILNQLNESKLKYPFVQKLRKGGYDGRGVSIIRGKEDLNKLLNGPSVIEACVDIYKELSVIAVRSVSGEHVTYPVVSMEFHPTANLVEYLICPADIDEKISRKARELADDVAQKLNITGILAIEMFLTKSGDILINELAPRPHNSGHHTLTNGAVSQFENHLRAICDLKLGSTLNHSTAMMLNVLGDETKTGEACYKGVEQILGIEGVQLYLYGKDISKPFRKMGHVTIIGQNAEICNKKAEIFKQNFKVIAD